MTSSLVYSTETASPAALSGEAPASLAQQPAPLDQDLSWALGFEVHPDAEEPWCGVCRRPTDHFAEHDDLVEAGLAAYDALTGSVRDLRARAAA